MIGRVVRRKDARGQFRFATEACDIVPEQGEFLAAKSHRGLHLVAPAEDALAVMEVRIGLEKYALPLVRAALLSRGANASEKAHCYHWRESTREHSCRE